MPRQGLPHQQAEMAAFVGNTKMINIFLAPTFEAPDLLVNSSPKFT